MEDNLSISTPDYLIEKGFLDNDLEKAKAYPVGYINKYSEMKMPDGKWKYVGKKGKFHPDVQHLKKDNFLQGEVLQSHQDHHKDLTEKEHSELLEADKIEREVEKKQEVVVSTALEMSIDQGGEYLYMNSDKFEESHFESLIETQAGRDRLGRAVELETYRHEHLIESDTDREVFSRSTGDFATGIQRVEEERFTVVGEKSDFSKLSNSQIASINAYTHKTYSLINRYLGKKIDLSSTPFTKKMVGLSISSINKGLSNIRQIEKLNKPVYRGYRPRNRGEGNKKMVDYMMSVGGEITEGTVMSTAKNMEDAFSEGTAGIFYRVLSHTSGKDISEISRHRTEGEVLFPSTTKFIVKQVLKQKENTYSDTAMRSVKNFVELEEST